MTDEKPEKAQKKSDLEKELIAMRKSVEKTLGEVRREFEIMKTQFKKFIDQSSEWAKANRQCIMQHGEFLEEITAANQNAEEILGNVLLAIRQNEYLQAWYPAQGGFPEMKVAGTHPLNLQINEKKREEHG